MYCRRERAARSLSYALGCLLEGQPLCFSGRLEPYVEGVKSAGLNFDAAHRSELSESIGDCCGFLRVFARSAFHAFRRVCVAAINDGHRDRRDLRPFLYRFIQDRMDELTRVSELYRQKTAGHGAEESNSDEI